MDDTLDLLVNNRRVRRVEPEPEKVETIEDADDNGEILDLLRDRMVMGYKKYGHGVQVDRNTKDFGTPHDDWELMALEEMLDSLIYSTAAIIRYRRKKLLGYLE